MRVSAFVTAERSARGASTISIAVLLLVVLLTTGGIALSVSTTYLYGGIKFQKHTSAMMLAESAVEDAMWHLDAVTDWSTLTLPQRNYTAPHAVGSGQAWADISNDASEASSSTDTNGLILVKGYGQMLNSSYLETIEVLYVRPTFSLPPVAGVNVCGTDLIDGTGGNITVSGFNHYLPPAPCGGSNCDARRKNNPPHVAGMAFEISGRDAVMSLARVIEGIPPVQTGQCNLLGPSGLCNKARLLMANASRLVGLERITEWPVNGAGSYGTVSDPKILYVPKGVTLQQNGTSQGAGILFVDGTLQTWGTFTWTGPVFVGQGGLLDLRGTANIFGAVVTAGSTAQPAKINMMGSGSINWAADAVMAGPFNMPGLLNSWREYR